MRFNPPPNWPAPPRGWEPAPHWQPDPSWPPPPQGWQLWVPESPPAPAPPPMPAAPPPRNGNSSSSIQASVIPTRSHATNRSAIAAVILAIVLPPVGILLGVSARRQVRRTHEGGDALAKVAIVLGGVLLVVYLVGAVVAALVG